MTTYDVRPVGWVRSSRSEVEDDGWDDGRSRIELDPAVLEPSATLGLDGLRIDVAGLDAIDGTPVLDVKPAVQGFAPRGPLTEPPWVTELMAGYW